MINYRELKKEDFLEFEKIYKEYNNKDIDLSYVFDHVYNKTYIVLDNNKIIGFIIYAVMYERGELIDVYVNRNYRRMGIAKRLIEIMLDNMRACSNISLEVRKDNIEAYNLYSKFGFKTVSVREKYYNGIDAYLMVKEVNNK